MGANQRADENNTICGHLRPSAAICGYLRLSAAICG